MSPDHSTTNRDVPLLTVQIYIIIMLITPTNCPEITSTNPAQITPTNCPEITPTNPYKNVTNIKKHNA